MKVPLSAEADRRRLFLAAAINAVLFAVVFTFLTLGWESNDDISMMHVASGATTGSPSEELLFSNILIGSVLKQLYRLTDRVNWYTLYLLTAHFATMTGLLYAFLRMRFSREAVILFVLLFAQFEIAILVELQFTSTAVMAGVAGVLLLFTSAGDGVEESRLAAVYGGLLIVLSGLIRAESMYYALVLLLPLLAYELAITRRWRMLAKIGVCVAVAFAAVQFDAWHYQRDARWRAFKEYTALRVAIHDLPIVQYEPNTRFFFDRIGWSYNDWGMFRNWFFFDSETFSRDHLETIVDRFKGSSWIRSHPGRYKTDSMLRIIDFPPLLYANVLLAILLAAGRRFRAIVIGVAECLWVEILLTLFSWYAKLGDRLILPALFAVSVVAFGLVMEASAERRFLMPAPKIFPAGRLIGGVAAVAFGAYYAVLCFQVAMFDLATSSARAREHRVYRIYERALLEKYVAKNPDVIFFNWGGRFSVHLASVFDSAGNYRRLNMLGLGWNMHSPQFDDAVERLELGNLYQVTYQNPNVYVFTAPDYLKQLARFVQEHYQQEIRLGWQESFVVDTDFAPKQDGYLFTVYQLAPGTPPADFLDVRPRATVKKLTP